MKRRDALRRLSTAAAALAVPLRSPAQANRIVLGQSAAFSGPAAQLGIQLNRGAQLYFDTLNAQGGVNGRLVDLRTLDDGYEPERCKANTAAFLKDEVFALFGYVGTATCLAALPLVLESKLPFFAPVTGAEALREPFQRHLFHVRASYFDETALIVKQLTSLGLKKIAVFHQNDAYGRAGLDGVAHALAPLGLAPLAVGTVERNSQDVAQALRSIAPTLPDAVVQVGAYKACAAFVRAARKSGYGGSFYNVSFVGTQALADELGKDGLGVMVTQVMPYPFSPTTPISIEYMGAIRKFGPGRQPDYSGMEGYLAAKVLSEGLKRAGRNLSREALITGLESMQGMNFGGFAVNFSARQHVASRFVDLSMLTGDGRVRV